MIPTCIPACIPESLHTSLVHPSPPPASLAHPCVPGAMLLPGAAIPAASGLLEGDIPKNLHPPAQLA